MKNATQYNHSVLLEGAILGSICNAIWLIEAEVKLEEQYWDNYNYNVTNLGGSYGTLSFAKAGVIGVFFEKESNLNPMKKELNYNIESILNDIPNDLLQLAKVECLQYMLQDYNGSEIPIITASIWSEDDRLYINDKWHNWNNNGGHLIEKQLRFKFDDAVKKWSDYYSFEERTVKIIKDIYLLRPDIFGNPVMLPNLLSNALITMNEIDYGIDLCRKHLKNINILF